MLRNLLVFRGSGKRQGARLKRSFSTLIIAGLWRTLPLFQCVCLCVLNWSEKQQACMSFSARMLICQRAGSNDKSVSQESVHRLPLYIFYSRTRSRMPVISQSVHLCMYGKDSIVHQKSQWAFTFHSWLNDIAWYLTYFSLVCFYVLERSIKMLQKWAGLPLMCRQSGT